MTLSERQRRILRWLGYPLLALVVFSFTLQLTFPYDRVKDKLVELMSEKYDVKIASASPTLLPGGMVLETILLMSRPTRPDEQPTMIAIDRLRVDVGLLALLIGRVNVDLVAEIGEGEIVGDITVSPSELAVEIGTEDLELENIPGLREALGLPMKGGLDAELDVTLPEQRWDLAEGSFTMSCPGCVVGDGKAKIKPKAPSSRGRASSFFAAEGLTVPALNLGELEGKISIISGKGVIDHFGAKSVDGDLEIYGTVAFGKTFAESSFGSACMKFRLSDALKQREAEFGNVPTLMGAPLDSEGYSNLIMSGKLAEMRWVAATSCAEGGKAERLDLRALSQGGGPSVGRGRPRLPTGEAEPTAPVIPGTDIPAPGSGETRPTAMGEEGGEPGATGAMPEPGEPGGNGVQRIGRGRISTDDVHPPENLQPVEDPAARAERPVDDRGDVERREVERREVEERAEREAEAARREADRRAEEAEQPDGDDGEDQPSNNERQGNEE
ncbi:MAG TPA: type II secretion system protein GspN [Haliangium sp.]|nr:type II secretion system protein GspN [Haliangium sp.]